MKMTKKERILAALNLQEVDRIPYGIWYHVPHVDQDPEELAELQIQQALDYDLDFIKLMPFGNYSASDFGLSCTYYCVPDKPVFERKFAIEAAAEWEELKVLPGCFGNHGKALMVAQQVAHQQKKKRLEIPFVQTVFSPLTIAKKLAGMRLFDDMRNNPACVHKGLEAITQTTINFVRENLEAGVAGFFFASQCSTYDLVSEQEYDEFGVKYDLQVVDAFKGETYFNIVHIHGDNTMFGKLASYPVNCINWHDRWVAPSMAEARKISNKCFMGGINEKWLLSATRPEEIENHVREIVQSAGWKGLILSPGCVTKPLTPAANYLACRRALDNVVIV